MKFPPMKFPPMKFPLMTTRWFALALLSAATIALADAPSTQPSTAAPATQPAKGVQYMRAVLGGAHPTFQTAIVKFHNATTGVDVSLVAAVHVADKAYFQSLNDRFAHYDAVLFEMVKPEGSEMPTPEQMKNRKPSSWVGSVQGGIKNMLDLAYQLEEVDYTKDNFIHADLTAERFEELQHERGESILGTMLKGSMQELLSGDSMNISDTTGMELMAALIAPDRPRQLKLILSDQIARSDKMIEKMEGKEGTVLLTERNKAAISALHEQIKAGKKNLAIFYGAAHLKLMAGMLEGEGYKQVGEPEWLVAWDMTAPTTQPAK